MTARSTPRRRPSLARWFLAAMLALIGAVAPIESPDLLGPLGELAGTSQALAQIGSVVQGTPDNCPTTPAPWTPRPSDPGHTTSTECELLIPPCLATPWDSSQFLQLSAQYPELCEISVASSDPNYAACTAMTGVVVDNDGVRCRIIQNAICPSGVRISPTTCRTVERRSWTCPSNAIPRNEFNTCYQLPTTHPGMVHPACGAGAPTLRIVSCADYAGEDFVDSVACSSYDPWNTPARISPVATTNYWCTYDASLLDVSCHAPGASCANMWVLCIKRASLTGGCSVVAKTINCRSLQAAYAAHRISLEDVRTALCEPCAILPFQPIPSSCPVDLTDEPTQESRSRSVNVSLKAILREESDFFVGNSACYPVSGGSIYPNPPYPGVESLADHPGCAALDPPCPDPSPGRLTWSSSHFSQLAVVNSAIVIEIHDIPTSYRTQRYGYTWGSRLRTSSRTVVEYPEPDPAEPDNILRLWNHPDDAIAYGSVTDLADNTISGTSECFLYYLPLFKIIVRELWPDNPSDLMEINELFGADALQWWHNINTQAERERRTGAQGFEWWPSLSAAEQEARTAEMTQEVSCDSSVHLPAWCRWQAPKAGYYRLTGAGAWRPTDAGNRQWIGSSEAARINQYLSGLSASQRNQLLLDLGVSTPQEAGINAAMDALIPRTAQDTLFSTLSLQARCPPVDVRVKCIRTRSSGNYVETEPVGIEVHEMRVSTVKPSS